MDVMSRMVKNRLKTGGARAAAVSRPGHGYGSENHLKGGALIQQMIFQSASDADNSRRARLAGKTPAALLRLPDFFQRQVHKVTEFPNIRQVFRLFPI
jgi:hypothetical protein